MFWADKIASDIIASGNHQPFWVDDMKTPSGRVHVGALRGVAIHGLIHQALLDQKQSATYTYIFNDMDPMDGFPHYLPDEFRQHMGKPLYRIPSPEPGFESLAQLYAQEFIM
jgi:lysyl-tRNA synthetase, class I